MNWLNGQLQNLVYLTAWMFVVISGTAFVLAFLAMLADWLERHFPNDRSKGGPWR